MAKRDYTNGEIVVHWDSEQCVHAKHCWQNLPQVFKPSQRPWVQMEGATSDEIIRIVGMCPTDALTWERVKTEDKQE